MALLLDQTGLVSTVILSLMMVFELPGGLFFTQFLLSIGGGSERLL